MKIGNLIKACELFEKYAEMSARVLSSLIERAARESTPKEERKTSAAIFMNAILNNESLIDKIPELRAVNRSLFSAPINAYKKHGFESDEFRNASLHFISNIRGTRPVNPDAPTPTPAPAQTRQEPPKENTKEESSEKEKRVYVPRGNETKRTSNSTTPSGMKMAQFYSDVFSSAQYEIDHASSKEDKIKAAIDIINERFNIIPPMLDEIDQTKDNVNNIKGYLTGKNAKRYVKHFFGCSYRALRQLGQAKDSLISLMTDSILGKISYNKFLYRYELQYNFLSKFTE